MQIDDFKMELSDMLLPLELQYRKQYEGDYTDGVEKTLPMTPIRRFVLIPFK